MPKDSLLKCSSLFQAQVCVSIQSQNEMLLCFGKQRENDNPGGKEKEKPNEKQTKPELKPNNVVVTIRVRPVIAWKCLR